MLAVVLALAPAALASSSPTPSEPAPVRGPVLPFSLPEPEVAAACFADLGAGVKAIDRDDAEAAVASLEAVTSACPSAGSAWIRLALLHAHAGRLGEAMRALEAAAALAPLPPSVAGSDSFEPLRESPAHADRARALRVAEVNMAPAAEPPEAATLGRSRDEIERGVASARARLEASGGLLTGIQHEAFDGAVAAWEAASLDRLCERATTRAERDRLRWEALSALVVDGKPRGGSVLDETIRRSRDPELLDSEHWVAAEQANVVARWMRDGLASPEGHADPALLERIERELLEIAASAPDSPVLEVALTLLIELAPDDLVRGRRLYRRLLAVAEDPDRARERVRRRFPGVVASAEGVPRFATKSLDGQTISNESLRGRPTLLQFWATWCLPCKKELPALRELVETESGLRVIGVAIEQEEDVEAFERSIAKLGITWPQVFETADDGELSSKFGASGIPEYVLLDPSGAVASHGSRLAQLRPAIERLLGADESGRADHERPERGTR